jgi:TRAP-type mannitol/chloroaromatic compound transport system substrate-binding protein
MRIPGLGGEVMGKLGVNVQVIPGGEVFLALDRGAIDAAEWVGPYDDEKLGLHKAAPFYYYPGWWEPGPTLDVLVNKSAWEKLPTEYQNMFMSAAKEANLNMLSQYNYLNQKSLTNLLSGGTKLVAYPEDIITEAKKISLDIYETNASKDSSFNEVYQPWKSFKDSIIKWNSINELSYADFMAKTQ